MISANVRTERSRIYVRWFCWGRGLRWRRLASRVRGRSHVVSSIRGEEMESTPRE